MSLVLKCSVCDDQLPNQYAPLGGCCGGYVCKREDNNTSSERVSETAKVEHDQLTQVLSDPLKHVELKDLAA